MKITYLLIAIILLSAPLARVAHAQSVPTSYHISVAPATAFLKVKPGTTTTHTILVRNPSDFGANVTIQLMDFASDGKTGLPQVQKKLSFPYITKDKSFDDPRPIPAKSQITIPITSKVPMGAKEQEYPITVLIKAQADTTDGTTALIPTIGSNMIVWITEREKPVQQLKVVSLQQPAIVDSFRPISFEPLVENLEIMSAVASGSAKIIDWRGQVMGIMQIYPDVILGQTTREIQGATPDDMVLPTDALAAFASTLMPANFRFTQPFWLGPYTIEFTFLESDETGDRITIQQMTVIALPISLLSIICLLAIILGGGRWWQKKRQVKSHDQNTK